MSTKTHVATKSTDVLLLRKNINHFAFAAFLDLCAVSILKMKNISRKFYQSHLKAKAKAKVRKIILSSIFNAGNLSFCSPFAKATRNNDSLKTLHSVFNRQFALLDLCSIYPTNFGLKIIGNRCVIDCIYQ